MHFIVVNSQHEKSQRERENFPRIYIHESQWDDYSYRTVCLISVQMKKDSEVIQVGSTKIMYKGQRAGSWTFDEISEFESLGSDFCSLARDFNFYEKIAALGKTFANKLLAILRDVAYQTRIWALFSEDPCFRVSLLRNTIKVANFRDDLKNLFSQRRVVRLAFKYELKMPGSNSPHVVNFDFRKTSLLPHRVMLLVGKNGVGKTQLMANLAISMTGFTTVPNVDRAEKIIGAGVLSPFPTFRSLIAISFNAFDKFEIPLDSGHGNGTKYTYCGLRNSNGKLCSEQDLVEAIASTVDGMTEIQRRTLKKSINNVLNVRLNQQSNLGNAAELYAQFSSGQRIVLNVLVHLIKNLEPDSLVLFDEPETHLHPNLMADLLSEIQNLLKKYRSYALLASHSPIVAQQIPSKSIRMISRSEEGPEVGIPPIECFGESLSEISNVLFEAKEKDRDYTAVIKRLLASSDNDAGKVAALFENGIGSNAKIYLWSRAMEVNGKL
jgi:predicted ATPase